jgi:hypothetical protein
VAAGEEGTKMRRFLAPVVCAVALGSAVPLEASSAGDAPFCGIRWGSLAKEDPHHTSATISNLRSGRHRCFDRLVIDLGPKVAGLPGPDASGFTAHYVAGVVDDPSGQPVALDGGAFLEVVVRARAVTDDHVPTYAPAEPARAVDVTGFRTFRQVAFLGTFEEATRLGLGVRARLPFRVFLLGGPGAGSRLVVDVAHRW